MAKDKSYNPVEVHRKNVRKRELEKQKTERRERLLTIKKNVNLRGLEDELSKIQRIAETKKEGKGKERVEESVKLLEDEIKLVRKAKEHFGLPFYEQIGSGEENPPDAKDQPSAVYVPPGKRLADVPHIRPDQSPYFHNVYNPFGVPPPGAIPLEAAIVLPPKPALQSSKGKVVYAKSAADTKNKKVPLPPGAVVPLKPKSTRDRALETLGQAVDEELKRPSLSLSPSQRSQIRATLDKLGDHSKSLDPSLVKETATDHIPLPSEDFSEYAEPVYFFETSDLLLCVSSTAETLGKVIASRDAPGDYTQESSLPVKTKIKRIQPGSSSDCDQSYKRYQRE